MAALKFLPLLILLPLISHAQQPCGIYATREDFVNNKVTYAFDDCGMKRKMNKDIVASHRGSRLQFDFRFIYGYSDAADLYRAYGEKSLLTDQGYYKVIYDQDVIVYQRTRMDHRSNKKTYYYFSLSKDSQILPLRKKFYDSPEVKALTSSVDFAAIRKSLSIPENGISIPVYGTGIAAVIGQKKKPDISARLQTTTRRPKVF